MRRAIAIPENEDLDPWLYLAALTGSAEFHPVLQQHARVSPERAYTLLALWGQREAVADLITGLADPGANAAAAIAWSRLTGVELPRIPRLTVVGEDTDGGDESAPGGTIADPDAARAWWAEHETTWASGERRFAGRPMSADWLARQALELAGLAARDVIHLLRMISGRPLTLWSAGLIDTRRPTLQAIIDESTPPAGVDTASATA